MPHRPYFGTVDATPLFVCLFVEAVRWLADRAAYDELLPSALAALDWCDTYGDPDGDGFVEYSSGPDSPLRNKGWKDSVASLSLPDGSPALLPAALVEVQAYVYRAKRSLADLALELGDDELAGRLSAEAMALQQRFEAAFWMEDEDCYAQALDANKRQVTAVTSNAGHALWAGIASRERAARLVERLMRPDMSTGWGIRTLSSAYPTYSPMSYHNGSVWPHDNALIVAGMTAYGHRDAAMEIVSAQLEAGRHLPEHRLPGALLRLRARSSLRVAADRVPRLVRATGMVRGGAVPVAPVGARPATRRRLRRGAGHRPRPPGGHRPHRGPSPARRGRHLVVVGPPHARGLRVGGDLEWLAQEPPSP